MGCKGNSKVCDIMWQSSGRAPSFNVTLEALCKLFVLSIECTLLSKIQVCGQIYSILFSSFSSHRLLAGNGSKSKTSKAAPMSKGI